MRRSFSLLVLVAALAAVLVGYSKLPAGDIAIGATLENFSLPDTAGAMRSFDDLRGKNGTVIIFLSAQCPVVRGYVERINAVAADYKAKGINFVGINSNATESDEWVKTNVGEYGYQFPVLKDKNNVIADKRGAEFTPETYFFSAKNVLLYHGAIDNDRSGRAVTEAFLRTAFDAHLAGTPIAKTTARAFGCDIKRVAAKQ